MAKNSIVICSDSPNFFGGNFWQHPTFKHFYWTHGKQPTGWTTQTPQRQTEKICAIHGLGYPENPFKLLGTKQVGRGGLAAMRLLHQLKQKFGDKLCIWPFEKLTPHTHMLLVEIYPRLFIKKNFGQKKIHHINQLNQILNTLNNPQLVSLDHITDHITDAIIAAAGLRFIHQTQKNWHLTPTIAANEGWIFGVPYIIPKNID